MWIKTGERLVNADNLSEIFFRNKRTRAVDLNGDFVDISNENVIKPIRDAIIRGQMYMEVE